MRAPSDGAASVAAGSLLSPAPQDLGSIVYDTRRYIWGCGLYGFTGVYGTRGIPILGQRPIILFEIPILYSWNDFGPLTRTRVTATHIETFFALQVALGFIPNPPMDAHKEGRWCIGGAERVRNQPIMITPHCSPPFEYLLPLRCCINSVVNLQGATCTRRSIRETWHCT